MTFEVDNADGSGGWSVAITGIANEINDPNVINHLRVLPFTRWVRNENDRYIGISLDLMSGRRITTHRAAAPIRPGRFSACEEDSVVQVNDISLAQTVASVVDAFERDKNVLDYLWTVMEARDDGAAVDDVVAGIFDGDALRLVEAHSLIKKAWREAGGTELAADLIAQTPDDRLRMFGPARDVVCELLD